MIGEIAEKRFTVQAILEIRKEIEECGGNEVFFCGTLNHDLKVEKVRVCARGNEGAVPAIFHSIKKGEVVIHNHPNNILVPSEADIQTAALFASQGNGVYIIDNDVEYVYVVIEPLPHYKEVKLDINVVRDFFSERGPLSKHLEDFELRTQQQEMAIAVASAFNTSKITVIEAPTGVGKTWAYLIPAILWSQQNKERVLISTRTIHLQEQILNKDLPVLVNCLKNPIQAVLVKGRSNYLCLRRFHLTFNEMQLFQDENYKNTLERISLWLEKTTEGSLSDLPFIPPKEIWLEICSEPDTCRPFECPYSAKCFFNKARKAIIKADLLILNHHLLFSDIAIKRELGKFTALGILPNYQRVIFDEAHHIEDCASEFFGTEITRYSSLNILGRLFRKEQNIEKGLLAFIREKVMRETEKIKSKEIEKLIAFIDEEFCEEVQKGRDILIEYFDAIRDLVSQSPHLIGTEIKLRLTEEILEQEKWQTLRQNCVQQVTNKLETLSKNCDDLINKLHLYQKTYTTDSTSNWTTEIIELTGYREKLFRLASFLRVFLEPNIPQNAVRWVEINTENPRTVRLVECPLEIGDLLSEWLFKNIKTGILTSATLSINQNFSYFATRLGLNKINEDKISYLTLETPFDFYQQAILCIITDLPEPNDNSFLITSTKVLKKILKITKGHALILFTSVYALDYAYKLLASELNSEGILCLKQGEDDRTRLLRRFQEDISSVLFATDSFWEGIDVAGKALQSVIVTRLPFRVPTDPLLEARAEAIEKAGGDSFQNYTCPHAIIKFRQGFGRLIRKKTDRGSIVVLDKRIVKKAYGRLFLEALPQIKIFEGNSYQILEVLKDFHSK